MTIYEKLMKIQGELKVPKGQENDFGGYKYRSCEDILETLKPILRDVKALIIINDDLVQIGDRYYVKATATLIDVEKSTDKIEATAYAREAESKKKMDDSQITGSTSSYARKYALNGLFAIDDTKDSDATNKHGKSDNKEKAEKKSDKPTTQAKIDALFKLAKRKGHSSSSVLKSVTKQYGVSNIADLTEVQYLSVVNGYEKLEDKK